jgi:superfamily I DNA/RNA helicase
MTERLLLIGDAGTGKTYYLYNRAKEFDDCILVSHTNAAINEFRRRDKTKAVNSRTLHSLCLSTVREKYPDLVVADDEVRARFCEKAGLEFDTNPYVSSPGKHFFSLRSLYINLLRPPLDKFCEFYNVNYEEFRGLLEKYEEFKKEGGYIDFEDMLELALEIGETVEAQVVIIDEAQDCSPLQWKVIETIFEADIIIAAGDELQSIFSFQGARPELFLSFSNKVKVLRRNYRVPKNIWDFAGRIVEGQLKRPRSVPVEGLREGRLKVTTPLTFEEAASYISFFGSGLVVVRHNSYCLLLEDLLKRYGATVRLVKRDGYHWNAVNVDTVHAVKGMEHERVFVLDAVKVPGEPLEEDRVWYTAVTRAKKELHVIPVVGEKNWFTPRVVPREEETRTVDLPTFSLSSFALQSTSFTQPAGSPLALPQPDYAHATAYSPVSTFHYNMTGSEVLPYTPSVHLTIGEKSRLRKFLSIFGLR